MTRRAHGRRAGAARRGETRSAAAAISEVLALRGLHDTLRAERVVTEWSELVGPGIAARTRPDGIRDRTLWIEVASSAWLHELNLMKPRLVLGLVERLGSPRLFDDVRFHLAGRGRAPAVIPPPPRRPPPPPRPLPPPATGAARERIVAEVARIDDPELRELVARVRITHDK